MARFEIRFNWDLVEYEERDENYENPITRSTLNYESTAPMVIQGDDLGPLINTLGIEMEEESSKENFLKSSSNIRSPSKNNRVWLMPQ